MLLEFWDSHAERGIHPDDLEHILRHDAILNWTLDEAAAHRDSFDQEKELHCLIHSNLFPQPFAGDLSRACVFILFGNPGFAITDYSDEHEHPTHPEACCRNLRGEASDLFLLRDASIGTGAYRYWHPRFRRIISEVSIAAGLCQAQATDLVASSVALIEAVAYHSKRHPGDWAYDLPSAQTAQAFVRDNLLPRAASREVLLFVWRSESFWLLPSAAGGVLVRPPRQAQASYLRDHERAAIVEQICRNAGLV